MPLDLRIGDPMTSSSGNGVRGNLFVTCIWPAATPSQPCCLTTPSPGVSPRSGRSVQRSRHDNLSFPPVIRPAPQTARPNARILALQRSKAPALSFVGSTTTGFACCSTPALSPGKNSVPRLESEHASRHSDEKSQNITPKTSQGESRASPHARKTSATAIAPSGYPWPSRTDNEQEKLATSLQS